MVKKINLCLLILASLVLGFGLCSCSNAKTETKATTNQSAYTHITFNVKDNATTGFIWEIKTSGDGEVLLEKQWVEDNNASDQKIVGAPNYVNYKYKATKPGKVDFHFHHYRPWEGGDDLGTYTFSYQITDDLKFINVGDANGNQKAQNGIYEINVSYDK